MPTPALSPAEKSLWKQREETQPRNAPSDRDIEEKYASREWRIVTESNREHLPNFVSALDRKGWMDLRPFYQRRPRWDVVRQSRLIESFIMNVPVPPLFVYEREVAAFEIMDGQQRVTAIKGFYNNEYKLKGLRQWPELNGRTYKRLPPEIRKGLDRRSISYTVLLQESAGSEEQKTLLRQLVFERLNTGGVALSQQEVRNCIYQGPMNNLLLDLAKSSTFRAAWKLPPFSEQESTDEPPDNLMHNAFFQKMTDVEVVLRFFALRHCEHYQRGMQGFLDLYMVRSRIFGEDDIRFLRDIFVRTLSLAASIYENNLFCPWLPKKQQWSTKPHRAFYDAVMVGIYNNLDNEKGLLLNAKKIREATKVLFEVSEKGTFTGRGNTKEDVLERIGLMTAMLRAKG